MSDSEYSEDIWSDDEEEFGPEADDATISGGEGEEEDASSEGESESESLTDDSEEGDNSDEEARPVKRETSGPKSISLGGGKTFNSLLEKLSQMELKSSKLIKPKKSKKLGGDDGSDEDELDDEGQKIAEEIANVFTFEGPEGLIDTKHHKKIEIVPDDERTTTDVLSQAEMTELIGIRATQIANSGIVYTDTEGLTSEIEMARKEFADRKCPLFLMRKVGEKVSNEGEIDVYERFDVNQLARRQVYK